MKTVLRVYAFCAVFFLMSYGNEIYSEKYKVDGVNVDGFKIDLMRDENKTEFQVYIENKLVITFPEDIYVSIKEVIVAEKNYLLLGLSYGGASCAGFYAVMKESDGDFGISNLFGDCSEYTDFSVSAGVVKLRVGSLVYEINDFYSYGVDMKGTDIEDELFTKQMKYGSR